MSGHSLTRDVRENKNLTDIGYEALRRLFVFNNGSSLKECKQVNYNSYTENWTNGQRSKAVCDMFETIANSNDSEYVTKSKMWSTPKIIETFIDDFFYYETPQKSSEFSKTNISDYYRYTACSKWTFNQTYYEKTIVTDFGLVCEDAWKVKFI